MIGVANGLIGVANELTDIGLVFTQLDEIALAHHVHSSDTQLSALGQNDRDRGRGRDMGRDRERLNGLKPSQGVPEAYRVNDLTTVATANTDQQATQLVTAHKATQDMEVHTHASTHPHAHARTHARTHAQTHAHTYAPAHAHIHACHQERLWRHKEHEDMRRSMGRSPGYARDPSFESADRKWYETGTLTDTTGCVQNEAGTIWS